MGMTEHYFNLPMLPQLAPRMLVQNEGQEGRVGQVGTAEAEWQS